MSGPIAVIDLGTNTFHLMITQEEDVGKGFRMLHRERHFVKLAEEGINRIGPAAFQRGINTLKYFKNIIERFGVEQTVAVGTAALRTASNGQEFVEEARKKTGLKVVLISGDREAELISKGVTLAIPDLGDNTYLIMDIGGGSVEFIITKKGRVLWSGSFQVGVAILYKEFHKSDPITAQEVEQIRHFLEEALQPLQEALIQYPCTILVGASGTFDVLENFVAPKEGERFYSRFPRDLFGPVFDQLKYTTLQQRLDTPEIPEARAEMLISALVLIALILEKSSFEEIIVSSFALKEGLIAEMMSGQLPYSSSVSSSPDPI